ncbi:MAG: zinc-dependent peptidase [Gammaproteobacteria bacterium]|nr:zinc-dependent peptidase [Gammaproteobacteria bacterium]
MLTFLRQWRERSILKRRPIGERAWRQALDHCAPARRLSASAQARLRVLATLFLAEKSLEPVQGLRLDDGMRVLLAVHACIPILNLGLKWYRGWHGVVLYPGLFIPNRQFVDAAGVVHHDHRVMAGESWQQGPLILSWESVMQAGTPPGHNVVIHEFAHKLDMLNGEANGFPPLHPDMRRGEWTRAFKQAYAALQRAWQAGEITVLDPYGLENPGEFFAVASEAFFETPVILRTHLPELYRQLCLFYRQDPSSL